MATLSQMPTVLAGQLVEFAQPVVIVNADGSLGDAGTGTGGLATAQVSVGTAATLIVAARAGRVSATFVQMGTTVVFLGGSNVSVVSGVPLGNTQYSTFTITGSAAIYGVVATGSQNIAVIENY